ncbi:MAG: hypothetical protein Q9171_002072 [Xanthocarpia ochracea]
MVMDKVGALDSMATLENEGEVENYKQFIGLVQKLPQELIALIEDWLYKSAFLSGVVCPSDRLTVRPRLLSLSRWHQSTFETRFWGENTFLFGVRHFPSAFITRRPVRLFDQIRKVHISLAVGDLEDMYVPVREPPVGWTQQPINRYQSTVDHENLTKTDMFISLADLVSSTYPRKLKSDGYTREYASLNDLLSTTWRRKFSIIRGLDLTDLTIDFSGCFNPVDGTWLGCEFARTLPFFTANSSAICLTVLGPDARLEELRSAIRSTNNVMG